MFSVFLLNSKNLTRCPSSPSYFTHLKPFLQPNTAKFSIRNNLFNSTRSLPKKGRSDGLVKSQFSKLTLVTFGGVGLGVTIALRSNCMTVHCESGRLKGLRSTEKDIRFDWKRFWFYLKPHFWKLIAAIVTSLFVAYLNIRIPTMLGDLVNALSKYAKSSEYRIFDKNEFLHDMKAPAFKLFSMYVFQSIFTFFYIVLLSHIGENMAARIRQDLFQQIVIQDLAFFDQNRTGELVNRLTADVQEFKHSFKQCISHGLRSFAQLVGGSVSLFMISPQLATAALISVPTAVLIGSLLGQSLRSLSKQTQVQSERATAVCEEALSNIRTVRSNACEMQEVSMFEDETNRAADLSQELGVGIAVFQALTNLFLNSMVLSTLSLGGYLMSSENISPGQLMAFLVASQVVQRSLAQGSILMGTLVRGLTSGSRVFEYLAIKPKIELDKGLILNEQTFDGEIKFENVTFTYPSRPNQVVLENFNLTLRPGQTVALVGQSGSGKSTIAALLERFYEPTGGRITIDGISLSEISPNWLRGQAVGFIEQQPILFGTTILENIRYGRPNAREEEIYQAARDSQCHEFISHLPEGYNTMVGERGVQLSGGQRQRIAIARALLKQPKILILDEATSALDANSEAVVQRALDEAAQHRTCLIIAHRLSTIKNADLIVVMDAGKVVEVGTHNELMNKKGYYFDLVKQQERMKEGAPERATGA